MPHYHQHHGRGGMPAAPPRRLITIAISVVSFFILAALAIAQFGPSSSELHARKLAQRIDHAQRANAQFQSRDDTPSATTDVTGPVVEIGFGGYADTSQIGSGLRQRLYSRAFIIGETKNPKNRVVYIVLDTLSGDTAVRNGVLDALKGLGDEYAVYGQSNIALTGTHSHSGPGAWLNYLLPQITTLGFSKQSYQAIVDGTVLSIKRAHESLQEGYLDIGTTDINDGNANRSPSAYLANPESERAKYPFNTDKTLTLLRFRRASDLKSVGVLTWYPVHGTSVYQNNTLVNGDNKGVAAYLFEQSVKGDSRAADGFVAGFSQANVGDTTPNTLGAFCDDGSGAACDFESSTCANGKVQACRGRGPFFQKLDKGVSSCYEIGRKQYAGAKNVWTSLDSSSTPVVGSTVRSFHYFHDMRYYKFNLDNGTEVQTCPAALGHSFAAGTTDGPGAFDFTQGDSGAPNNPFWSVVGGLLRVPSASQKACQKPKPILLDVGEMDLPYPWTPNIIDVQTLRVGQFFMIISPSEATTMSGRRWRDAVKTAAKAQKLTGSTAEPVVVLGEYAIQRYEGASTLFGQYTLPAYINLTLSALPYLSPSSTSSPPPGPSPPDNRDKSLSFITGVVYDGAPPSKPFGTCITQPSTSYTLGSVVTAVFQGANPRNNLRLEGTFVAIEKLGADGKTWTQVRNDEDWDLTYEWKRTNGLLGYSEVTVRWETRRESNGEGADEGGRVYRVRYWGDAKKAGTGKISAFEGTSRQFRLT
ncbi:Neutral/alkaline nonlysosomal ceramidase [Sordaria brevicollis]|uniref:Neutral ceramidase n=1 Tax=Sordaria brevicollis TaxID=83679 RepID=A0AAE0PM64_SORBR|nr:Neutral/alkaline nonlysosomal ceramidase [Sordaria brevicollis]